MFHRIARLASVLVLIASTAWAAEGPESVEKLAARAKEIEARLKAQKAGETALARELARTRQQLEKAKEAAPPPVTSNQIRIPRLKTAPRIDGAFDPKEWAGAAVYPGTAGAFRMLARAGTVFYIGWDPDNLYIAQRMRMRKNEKPVIWNREPRHDNVYALETVVEVYVDRHSFGSHPSLCWWQFMGNAAGNKWDMEAQHQIGQRYYDWTGQWDYAQRLTPDGEYWETEIAIPRTTVYQKTPIKEGDIWYLGMAASLQNPFSWSGFYGPKIAGLFCAETPVIILSDPAKSLDGKRVYFDLSIDNTTARKAALQVVARLTSDRQKNQPVYEKKVPVSLAPGARRAIHVDDAIAKATDRTPYTLTVMVLDGPASLYTWSRGVSYNDPGNFAGAEYTPDPAPFKLTIAYMPLSNFVTVDVDKYYAKDRDRTAKARFTIRPRGANTIVGRGEITKFSYEKGSARVPLPATLTPGVYECTAELVDKAGAVLASQVGTFERKDHAKAFPWLDNTIGEDDVVLKPFEPLHAEGNRVRAFKKEIVIGGDALPASIHAAGVDLLAGPIELRGVTGGKPFTVKPTASAPKAGTLSATRADYTGRAAGGPLSVSTTYHLEYDGTARVTMRLEPKGQGGSLDSLQLVIPFKTDAATHYMANGLNMRESNQAGYVPGKGKTGVVWDSRSVKAQKMTVGSFVPIVHLGNLLSGLTWFADSDRGWWPSGQRAAIEIVRTKAGTVELVLNLASEKVAFAAPRQIEFGLCVVPARPMSPYRSPSCVVGFGGLVESGRWDPKVNRAKVYARLYPDNMKKWNEFAEGTHRYNDILLAYTEQSPADFWKNEFDYFKYEWGADAATGGTLFCDSANDCRLYWTEKWVKEGKLDGYYMDNVFCRLYRNTWSGKAYALPDGRIQPAYDLWGLRAYVKRLRTVFQKYRDPAMICIHNTRFQMAPILAFADLAMGGEMATPRGGSPDFMDMYPRDFMDVMYNQYLWGYQLSHLYHFNWDSFKNDLGEPDEDAAMKAHRTAMATMLVHGVEFFQGIKYKGFLMSRYTMLKKIAGGTLEFIPSWNAGGLFKVSNNDPEIDVAVYRGADVLIVIAANYSKHERTALVWLDFPKLIRMPGKMERRVPVDMESLEFPGYLASKSDEPRAWRTGSFLGGHNTMRIANELRFRIKPRDFRAFVFLNLPCAQGAGF